MPPHKCPVEAPTPGLAGGFDGDAPVSARLTFERRLAGVERELRIQFTRIAQLQAELDVALARRPATAAGRADHRPPGYRV